MKSTGKLLTLIFKQISIRLTLLLSIFSFALLVILNIKDKIVYITFFEVYLPFILIALSYNVMDSAMDARFSEFECISAYTFTMIYWLRYTVAVIIAIVLYILIYVSADLLNGSTIYSGNMGEYNYDTIGFPVILLACTGTFLIYTNVFSIVRIITHSKKIAFISLVVFFAFMNVNTTWTWNIYSLLFTGDDFVLVKFIWIILLFFGVGIALKYKSKIGK